MTATLTLIPIHSGVNAEAPNQTNVAVATNPGPLNITKMLQSLNHASNKAVKRESSANKFKKVLKTQPGTRTNVKHWTHSKMTCPIRSIHSFLPVHAIKYSTNWLSYSKAQMIWI